VKEVEEGALRALEKNFTSALVNLLYSPADIPDDTL
jgi:hypothetical protein